MQNSDNRILHLGLGAFHRAHQAACLQNLIDAGDRRWSIVAANIRPDPADASAALLAQGCSYTLETVDPVGNYVYRSIGAISNVLPYSEPLAEVVAAGADPATRIVSFTVTEAGYFIGPDGAFDAGSQELEASIAHTRRGEPGMTIYSVLAAILRARRASGAGALTLLCCDNLRHNGERVRALLAEFLTRAGDAALLEWVGAHASFPNSMVDRITPRATPELRARVLAATGRDDAAAVMSESFFQWVIEDDFANGRPAWENGGAQMVDNVAPFEEAKIRILNASHSCIAWAGALKGYRYIHEAVRDPRILALVRAYVDGAVFDCLRPSPVDLEAYRDAVIARFSSDAVCDTVERVLADSVAKLPGFIVPTIRERLARGQRLDDVAALPALYLIFLCRWQAGLVVNPDWKLSAFVLTQKVESQGNGLVDVNPTTLAPLYGELTQRRFAEELSSAKLDVANLTINGRLGAFDLVSSTTVQDVDASQGLDGTAGYGVALGAAFGIPDLGVSYAQGTSTHRVSQELPLRSKTLDDKLDYEAGVYYTKEDNTNRIPGFRLFSTTTNATYPLPSIVKASIDTSYKEYSVFANATYALTPQWDLMAGIRHGKDDQVYAQDYSGLLVGPVPVRIDANSDKSKTTYLASARYKPSENDALYARVATGFRPGGPNAVPPTGAANAPFTFAPDTLTSYELGYKSMMDGGRISVEAALFATEWKDIQIQTSAAGFNFLVNGGAATSRGAELAVSYFPLAGLSLRGALGYTDAQLTEDAPAAGGLDGDELPFVPKITGSIGANYRWSAGSGWAAYAGGSVNHTGKRRSDFSERAAKDVDAYTTVNLSGGIENSNWRLAVYAKNLNNSDGVTFLKSQSLSPSGSPFGSGVIAPRTIGADLSYRF